MKMLKKLTGGLVFVLVVFFFSDSAMAMANREGVNWRTNNADTFIVSVFQAVLGRAPNQNDIIWARGIGNKTGIFWALIGSQEYKNIYNFPRNYNIYKTSKWIRNADGGLVRMCNCYYFAKFAYDHLLEGPYTFDVARALVLKFNAFDREACPYYDCGYSDLGTTSVNNGNITPIPRNNLVQDPNFSNFNSSSGPWGRNVLYGNYGIWWNSRHAKSSATKKILSDGNSSLYIVNKSGRSPHVYGTTAQRIKTSKGKRYQISFWGSARNLASNGALNIAVDPQWRVRPVKMEAGSYNFKKFSGTFTAKADYIDLRIIMEDRGEVWITKMTMQEK